MTLVTRLKPPAYHKKTVGRHHKHGKKYNKTYWPYIPLLLIVGLGLVFNSILPGGRHGSVLGYATGLSTTALLNDTNTQRQANGVAALSINQLLNTAAQAKAQDMANRNYWSHNTPDGQTPWTFMTAAGYNYQLAGENLAYGFNTSSETLTGWMNSPGHRANILNAGYKEVGFGFINIANYQNNGPETLVVAMYGTLPAVAPTTVAAVTNLAKNLATVPAKTPAPASPVTKTATPSSTPTPTTTPVNPETSTPAPITSTPAATNTAESPTSSPPNSTDTATPVQTSAVIPQTANISEPAPQSLNRLNLLGASNVGLSSAAISIVGILALIIFFLRHGIAWHKILVKGEHFVLKHPLLDVVLVASITTMFVLIQHAGNIR